MIELLINADDFGYSKNVNEAINYGFQNGLLDRTTIMVNMSSYNEAVNLSKQGNYFDKVGLHINLIEGIPLTEEIKNTFFCKQGKFDSSVFRKQKNRFFLNRYVSNAVKKEIEAQIIKYISSGFTLMHIDSHQHSHTNPSIYKILKPLMLQYGFNSIRLSKNIYSKKTNILFKIYKNYFNLNCLHYMKLQKNENIIPFFASQSDIQYIIEDDECYSNIRAEMMVHPIMKNNVYFDEFRGIDLERWIKLNEKNFKRITK